LIDRFCSRIALDFSGSQNPQFCENRISKNAVFDPFLPPIFLPGK